MAEIKEIVQILKDKEKQDEINYNLYLRSLGKPASMQYGWNDPIEADGVPVKARKTVRDDAPNLMTSTEIFNDITSTKASYMASNIQREYTDDIEDSVKDKYLEYDRITHTPTLYHDLAVDCAGWGGAYTLTYWVELDGKKQAMSRKYNAWNGYVSYNEDTLLPEFACIYGCVNVSDNRYTTNKRKEYFINVYTDTEVISYKSKNQYDGYKLDSTDKHGFTEVPVVEWKNNKFFRGDAEKAVSLIDAYEAVLADNSSEGASFANAYLMLKQMGSIDENVRKEMQQTGVFWSDEEGASAEFVIKNINPEFVKMLLDELRKAIYEAAQGLDPRTLSSMKEMRKAQADNIYAPLDKISKNTERQWDTSLELLDRVLKSFWTGLATPAVADYDTFYINYLFRYDKPTDILTDLKDIKAAGGILPNWYILSKSLNIDEDKARDLAKEANEEMTEALPVIE